MKKAANDLDRLRIRLTVQPGQGTADRVLVENN